LLGLDFHAFKNTVLYGANDIFKFADPRTKDSERKDMLHRILRTDVLKGAHRKALDKAKELRNEMAEVDRKIERLDVEISTIDLPSTERRRDEWAAKRDEKVEVMKRQAVEYKAKAEELEGEYDTSDEEAALESARDELKALGSFDEEALSELEDAVDDAAGVVSESDVELRDSKRALKAAEAELARLGDDECPLCTSPLDSGAAGEHHDRLVARRDAETATSERATSALRDAREALSVATAKRDAARRDQREIRRLEGEVARLERELEGYEAQQERDEIERGHLIERAVEALKRAKELRSETNPHAESYKADHARVMKLNEQLEELGEERATLEVHAAHVQFWVRGYSNAGLPSYVLDSVMPFISARANHYLETLSDGDITMNFSTQRELKSKRDEVRDEISITVNIEGNEDVTPSSGQRTKMNIATDLALMDLVSTREGGCLDLLMIDEVLDGLDDEGSERVLALLHELRSRRSSIYVISHGSTMAEIFEHGIKVVKDEKVAHVEVLS
jgi:DNA repair exonuclease SbcCD ATPase subunit